MDNTLTTLIAMLQDPPQPEAARPLTDPIPATENGILHMDNLQAMGRIEPASLDFVYLDPPFASSATYYHQVKLPGHSISLPAYSDHWEDGVSGYLEFLIPRLIAVRPLLKPTGSICVHLDSRASHYVKIALDHLFGAHRLINEVIWRYGKMSNTSRRFPQNHDTLLIYGASEKWCFSPIYSQPSEYRTRFQRDLTGNRVLYGTVKHRSDKLIQRRISARTRELGRDLIDSDVLFDFDIEKKVQEDVFTDISIVRGNAHEGVGYDTQKPQKLLERLISAFCPADGTVADFFGGSGTTAAAAAALNRRWILAERGTAAIQKTRLRLQEFPHRFERDPALAPRMFLVDDQGEIADFRLNDLQLAEKDREAVERCLQATPEALIAGRLDETIIDVFGREATLL